MTPAAIVDLCASRGVDLFLDDGGGLRYGCRFKGALTPELRALVKQHRADVIRLLQELRDALSDPAVPFIRATLATIGFRLVRFSRTEGGNWHIHSEPIERRPS